MAASDGFSDYRREGTAPIAPLVVDRVVYAGWIVAVVGGGTLLVVHLANAFTVEHHLLDANREGTVWTWASVVAAATVAVGAGLRFATVPSERGLYGALAVAAAFLSLDDLILLHERLVNFAVELLGLPIVWDSVLWPIFYAPLLGAVVIVVELVARRNPAGIRLQARAGIALLAAAIALEIVSAPWSTDLNVVHTIEGGFEEAAEQAGWTLLASAIIASALRDLSAEG